LERVTSVAPVWRPMLHALSQVTDLSWHDPGTLDTGMVPWADHRRAAGGSLHAGHRFLRGPSRRSRRSPALGRELLATGGDGPWRDRRSVLQPRNRGTSISAVLAASAELPIHFSHGVIALWSREGQACRCARRRASERSQPRSVRPPLRPRGRRQPCPGGIASDWAVGLRPPGLGSSAVEQWHQALDDAVDRRGAGTDPRPFLIPGP